MATGYKVDYTETGNPAKPSINVADQTLNSQTSVTFVGKNYNGYAPVIAQNFLHLLENFASPTGPSSPVQGQLWYDNSTGVNLLKVWDGTQWNAAGAVKKSSTAPTGLVGDLWIDTTNKQLYIYSGSNWLLVGPQFAAGTQTGPVVENIIDAGNPPVNHSVITYYANNTRISIIASEQFTPKSAIQGFITIYPGINIANNSSDPAQSTNTLFGRAYVADNLNYNGASVSALNFLRSDQTSKTNYPLQINSAGGISLGSGLNFNITSDNTQTLLYNNTSGASVNFQINNTVDGLTTVLHLDASEYVGIGKNNLNPQEALDVAGNIVASGEIYNQSNLDSTHVGTGALVTTGGLSVNLNSNFGGTITAYGVVSLNNLSDGQNGNPQGGAVIQPGSDAAAHLYDIGTPSRPFRNIYADSFVGGFSGSFSGTLQGNITGTASALASATAYSITGDLSSNTINFNGQSPTGTLTFDTTLNSSSITGKTGTALSYDTDLFLVYRSDPADNTGVGLKSTTKSTFLRNVATVPVGAIFPYAGATPPNGYLLCDGSEVLISLYFNLYQVIGYTYKLAQSLQGIKTFGLPDLRGRFPLGADNMDNGNKVPSIADPTKNITTITTPANHVSDVTARVLGSTSGSQSRTLDVTNLPDHRHTLNSGNAQYYAAGLPGAPADSNAVPGLGLPTQSTGSGYPSSGGVTSSSTGQPVSVMNPYQTINYIIFTGVIS
jgi:microcystin-dependent protein